MYKKDDYILFMTNEPQVHFNEMFGYNDLTVDDFEKTEHIGFIKTVIDEETYLVVIVRPILGFRCIVNKGDILRSVCVDELSDEEKNHREDKEFLAPNVFLRNSAPEGKTLDEKCVNCAKEAVANLFPEEEIAWARRSWSSYMKQDMLSSIERAYEGQDIKLEKVDYFKNLLHSMRFKEYFFVNLDVYETPDKTSMLCFLKVICCKVIITKHLIKMNLRLICQECNIPIFLIHINLYFLLTSTLIIFPRIFIVWILRSKMLVAHMNFIPKVIQLKNILGRISQVTTENSHSMTNIDFRIFSERCVVCPGIIIVTVAAVKNHIPSPIITTGKLKEGRRRYSISCEKIISGYH